MTDVWSGGIIYMYFQEANDYGLVTIDGDEVKTLDDFNNLKSQMASIDPTSATSGDASSTSLSCPSRASTWNAASVLPPAPRANVCACLTESFSCVVSSDVDLEDYGDLFGTVCGEIDCDDISVNGSSGVYGLYSYCDDDTKLSFVLNKYYEENNQRSDACDFDGSASLASSSVASSCTAILSEASANPSGSANAGSPSTSGSGSGSSSSSDSNSTGSSSGDSSSSGVALRPSVDISAMMLLGTFVTVFFGGLSVAFI
jgi:hypothetical protein